MPFFFAFFAFFSVVLPKAQRMQSASRKQSNSQGTACQDSSEHSLLWILRHTGQAVIDIAAMAVEQRSFWGCGSHAHLDLCNSMWVTSVPSALLVFMSRVALTITSSTFAALLSRDHSQTLVSDSCSLCRAGTFEGLSWDVLKCPGRVAHDLVHKREVFTASGAYLYVEKINHFINICK